MFKYITTKYRALHPLIRSALFIVIFNFIAVYYVGSHSQLLAYHWELFDSFLPPDEQSNDLSRIEDLIYMVLHGNLVRAFTSAWSLAPFWFTTAFSLSMTYLYFMLEKVKYPNKTHPLEYVVNTVFGILIIFTAYQWYSMSS